MALAWPFEAFGFSLDCDEALPPAALPPTPIEVDVPLEPVEVPAVPKVEADVPPAAALPPLPIAAEEPDGDDEAPPVAPPLADCAEAHAGNAQRTRTHAVRLKVIIACSYLLS
jgi:hypothetical protein